jgi:amino acid adenylation domain-containing protein
MPEDFWVEQFKTLNPLIVPFVLSTKKEHINSCYKSQCPIILTDLLEELIKLYPDHEKEQIILSTFLVYFYRLNNYEAFYIIFSCPKLNQSNNLMNLVNWVPFTVDFDPENKFQDILIAVRNQYEKIIQNGNFSKDLFSPYSSIANKDLQLAIVFSDTEYYSTVEKSLVDIVINSKNNRIDIFFSGKYPTAIEQLSNHFITFLSSLSKEKNRAIKFLSLLSSEEKKKLAITWNRTKFIDLKSETLNSLFEKQAVQNPNKIALIFEEKQLTYSQLNIKVNQLACYIQEILVIKNSHIVIYLPRCIEFVLCMLAVLKSGNAYVPITVGTPITRVRTIVSDCDAQMILTNSYLEDQFRDIFANTQVNLIKLDKDWEYIGTIRPDSLTINYSPNHIAYVLYTSGSTGEPKGVQITHRSLINFLLAINFEINFTKEDILLAITPFTFDISGLEIYLPLISGACCILASYNIRLDPQKIADSILQYKVTIMQATPATWQMLMNINWKNEQRIKMLCGGEELNTQLAGQLLATGGLLWNLYGPTETTIWSTAYRVEQILDPFIPIGKPIANTLVYVLDKHQQLLPVGIPGTLYIGGVGVAQGYLNKPQLTDKNFMRNPFLDKDTMMYNTGDQVRWLSNGNLVYLCRIDNQVKIRGYRIELGEIETSLLEYPGISQAIVLNKIFNSSNSQLVAYLILAKAKGNDFNRDHLIAYLKNKLFEYMIPNYFVILEELPINSNGKIDKKALLALPITTEINGQSSLIPSPIGQQGRSVEDNFFSLDSGPPLKNNYEETAINLLKQLTKLESIDPETNFFNLGIHSLLLVEFSTLLKESFNCEINVIDLFTYPTVRKLTHFLMSKNEKKADLSQTERAEERRKKGMRRQHRYET